MLLTDAELEEFWQAAASTVPIVIIGGGRWGRTWSIAASRARGSAAGITLAARTDPAATREWAKGAHGAPDLMVAGSLSEALEQADAPVMAIIASRPRDHVRDGMEALSSGLDLLIEKPISDVAGLGAELVAAARQDQRLIAIGTEFAFLPSFHHCAREIIASEERVRRIRLYWNDPYAEFRHGSLKRQHDETNALVDLLPHAYSIFCIFSRGLSMRISDFCYDASLQSGQLFLIDEIGTSYELNFDKKSHERRRFLEANTVSLAASVDFGDVDPRLVINGTERVLHRTLHMRSTLRLALGAFLLQRSGSIQKTPITDNLDQLLLLQSQLEG